MKKEEEKRLFEKMHTLIITGSLLAMVTLYLLGYLNEKYRLESVIKSVNWEIRFLIHLTVKVISDSFYKTLRIKMCF